MAAVELNPATPSAEIVRDASRVVYVTDRTGRKIGIKRPGILAEFRLTEIVGPDTAKNEVYMSMALPLMWVVEIDGDPVYQPKSKAELEVLITRLEQHGITAIVDGIVKHFEDETPTVDQVKNA